MITVIIPYYRSPIMIRKQMDVVAKYPSEYKIIVVDDCSPEPVEDLVLPTDRADFYRIEDDIPWNREGARNLGATLADTKWILQVDTDHILPAGSANALLSLIEGGLDESKWYRFSRYRIGKADDTRMKDDIPREQSFGQIKPHIDSYLCTKELYWEAGGYNENYSGCLGGGGPFLKRMKEVAGDPLVFEDIFLMVYTRDSIPDASVSDLSRDKTDFKQRRKVYGHQKAENPLRFKWKRIII